MFERRKTSKCIYYIQTLGTIWALTLDLGFAKVMIQVVEPNRKIVI